jgi:RimJ/RimL family protein N-acetyltransferase
MTVVRPAVSQDVDLLIAAEESAAAKAHHRTRWGLQERGDGLFLLALRDHEYVGHMALLRGSKYAEVRAAYDAAEINALHAYRQGQGIGTAMIAAGEARAADWGHPVIGLAVEPGNVRARRLYERLGYREWDNGLVLDDWTEEDENGVVVRIHRDPCHYLLKELSGRRTRR